MEARARDKQGAIPRRRLEMYSVEKMEMGKKQA
jgi:hypothetical protein